jgi:hypothetical protein
MKKNEMGITCSIHDKLIKDFCRKTWRKLSLAKPAKVQSMVMKSILENSA